MTTFAGKVALVTGGTSGIDRTTAIAFAQQGANVVIVSQPLTNPLVCLGDGYDGIWNLVGRRVTKKLFKVGQLSTRVISGATRDLQ